MDFFSTPVGDGLLKLVVTLALLGTAVVLVRAALRLAGRLAALGCLAIIVLAILAAIWVHLRGG